MTGAELEQQLQELLARTRGPHGVQVQCPAAELRRGSVTPCTATADDAPPVQVPVMTLDGKGRYAFDLGHVSADDLPDAGLFCRDLATVPIPYLHAVWYWFREGMPHQMDADRNGVPCETVYDRRDVFAVWQGTEYRPSQQKQAPPQVVADCSRAVEKPAAIVADCAGRTTTVTGIAWKRWSRPTSIGTGTVVIRNCGSGCRNGEYEGYLTLSRLHEDGRVFTRLTVDYADLNRTPRGRDREVFELPR